MFSVQRLTSLQSLHRRQQFESLLSSAESNAVRQIWVNPGHVFVSWASGRRLTTFATVPAQTSYVLPEGGKTALCREEGCLDLQREETEVVTLCFKKKNPSEVYVIFVDGQVEVWVSRRNEERGRSWALRGAFELWSGAGRRVCSAVLHEGQNCLYWCEKRADTSPSLSRSDNGSRFVQCVSKKALPLSHETVSSYTVGSTFTLLEHCPPCRLYPTKDGVVVWPEQPCPAGLYFMWQQTKNILQTCILGTGCVSAHTLMSNGVSFADAVKSSVFMWAQRSQSKDNSVVSVIKDFSQDQLLIIFDNGGVKVLSSKGCLRHKCHIAKWATVFESVMPSDCEWFTYTFVIGAVLPDGRVFLFHTETGTLIQEIKDVSESDLDGGTYLWVGSSHLPSVGFWNSRHGMCQLCMSDVMSVTDSMRTALPFEERVSLLTGLGQKSHAAQLTLEEIFKYCRDRTIFDENIDFDSLMKKSMLQSPALLVALLHQHSSQASGRVESDHVAQLMTFHDNGESVTRLQEMLHPLLEQFWHLETKWRSLIEASGSTEEIIQEETIQSEMRILLKSEESISSSNIAQLELLSLSFPRQGLRMLLQDLHINDLSESSRDGSDQRTMWTAVLSTERNSSNMALFDLICRLLYREEPSQLVAFVRKASYVRDDIRGPSALSSSSSLYDRALQCLPMPQSSSTNMDTVVAYCKLLAATSNNAAVLEALKLLLRFGRHTEAVNLVSKYPDQNSQHSALFHTLLTNVLESGMLQHMDRSIWGLVPRAFGAGQLLSLIAEHLPTVRKRKGRRVRVLCSSPNDISLSVLKGVLLGPTIISEHDA